MTKGRTATELIIGAEVTVPTEQLAVPSEQLASIPR